MHQTVAAMTQRVADLRRQLAATSAASDISAAQVEDMLAEGYACALSGDAWSAQAEHQLRALLNDCPAPLRGDPLREIAREHAELQRHLLALRRELSELRRSGRAAARGWSRVRRTEDPNHPR